MYQLKGPRQNNSIYSQLVRKLELSSAMEKVMGRRTILCYAYFLALCAFPINLIAFADDDALASRVCHGLEQQFRDTLYTKNETLYEPLRMKNWVETAWGWPTCILRPSSTRELKIALSSLVNSNQNFAIRSGGHSPHHNFANIDGGVLIDMSGFNHITYDSDNQVVVVGPGLTWGMTYEYLEKYGVVAVGGRVLDVGVGGLVLGGGLSWHTDLYGLACDNVVNFQVLLANGSLVNANARSNSDLFWALKGGGNNFGIITELTLMTYPLEQVWGGIRTYTIDQFPEVVKAYFQYQSTPEKDPYANLHVLVSPTNSTIGVLVSMVYLKPVKEPPSFAPFYPIDTTSDSTAIKSFTEYLAEYGIPEVRRFDWFTTTFSVNEDLFTNIGEIILSSDVVEEVKAEIAGFIGITLQPISTSAVEAGELRGGNALGLKAINQTWLATALSWWWPWDDRTVHTDGQAIVGEFVSASEAADVSLPYLFMNDASWDQKVIESYGEVNVKKLKEVQRRYDPDHVFQRLVVGGFKLPA
ncbi:putative FAD-binding oxidoreductase [Xylaria scruposa]|nr:putative FAD-binding oxidoreductase [Xylaria scruposa]